jgi:flagellar protein FlaG
MNIDSINKPVNYPAATTSRSGSSERLITPEPVVEAGANTGNLQAAVPPIDRARVEQAAFALQEFAQSVRRDINFRVDDGSGQLVIKVTDLASGDLIRQIPSEEALQIVENLDAVRSKLFSAEA